MITRISTKTIALTILAFPSTAFAQTVIPGSNTFPQTENFFENDGANVQRINDRVFVGGGAINDASQPDTHLDWLSTNLVTVLGVPNSSETPYASQMLILNSDNPTSHSALTIGAQTLNEGDASGAAGLNSYCHNNNVSHATPCWAGYFDAKRMTSSSGPIYAIEADPGSLVAASASDPFQQGNVVGLQLASGGEYPATGQHDASAAIQIQPNPTKFKQGIVFGSGAIAAGGYAVAMPRGQGLAWYSSAGAVDATLVDVSGVLTPSSLLLTNATGLPLSTGVIGILPSANGGVDATPWSTYSAAVICTQTTGTANCAANGRYKVIGKTTFVEVGVTVSGTFAGGSITSISLPNVTANHGLVAILNGRETSASGLAWTGVAYPNSSTLQPFTNLNSNAINAGYQIYFAGSYESQ